MRFLISVIDHATARATPQEMADIGALNDSLRRTGAWIFAGGLAEPREACIIDARGARTTVTPGPFAVTDEYVSGFWLIEASDHAAAERIATDASRACARRVEMRALL